MTAHVKQLTLTAAVAASVMMLGGCSIVPIATTDAELTDRATNDLSRMFAEQEAVTAPVTLSDAIARAIKYNLDYRTRLMQEALAQGQAKAAKYDLLPQLTVAAGYSDRSNTLASSSTSVLTNTQSLEPSTSHDDNINTNDVSLVWNILDFGVSYATAKQQADQVNIAREQKRKAIQNIVQDVRYAWWRAVVAQKLQGEIDALIEQSQAALKDARALEDKRVKNLDKVLGYQRDLLESIKELWTIRRDLSVAKTELGTLMNIKPGTEFSVAAEAEQVAPLVNQSIETMELTALKQRPEVREQDYQARIDQQKVRKAMLRMLPGLEVNFGEHYDSNSFLVNNSWSDAGLSISWNLFNLLSGPARKAAAEAELEVTEYRRMALSMAIVTQVHLALQRYKLAEHHYNLNKSLADVHGRLVKISRAGKRAKKQDSLSNFKTRVSSLVARMRSDLAYAELQNAYGRILNSLGNDPLPADVASHDIDSLSKAIADHLQKIKIDEPLQKAQAKSVVPAVQPVIEQPVDVDPANRETEQVGSEQALAPKVTEDVHLTEAPTSTETSVVYHVVLD